MPRPTERASLIAGLLVAGLLFTSAPAWSGRAEIPERPDRQPPWGDRWEPPRPQEPPELDLPVDAATFAADCNDDGTVRVGDHLEVRGGSGTLAADCLVEIADAASLTLSDVTLAGPYAFAVHCGAGGRLVVANSFLTLVTGIGVSGRVGAALVIRESELSSMAGGAIEIVLEGDGSGINVRDSMIMSDGGLLIDVAPRADGGRIAVRNVTLSVGGGAVNDLALTASLDGMAGEVVVLESQLVGSALIAIETGEQGRTEVRDSLIETAGRVLIAAGDGGSCESTGNDPPLACPPSIEGGDTAVATAVSDR